MRAQYWAVENASQNILASTNIMWFIHIASHTLAVLVAKPTGKFLHWPCTNALHMGNWKLQRSMNRPSMSNR